MLIDDPWMQRLRRLRQNQWAYMVYPGLQHTRFEHSLGVMHLAGEFARSWYSVYRNAFNPKRPSKRFPTVHFVEEIARLAGLLHDIGHGPFSHSFEQAAKKVFDLKFPKHEGIAVEIVKKYFARKLPNIRRSPNGSFAPNETITWEHVVYLIDKNFKPRGLNGKEIPLLRLLKPIISGLFDADRMDYLARDAYHGGAAEYGTMDIERLRTTVYFDKDGTIAIPYKSMPALRNLLLARLQMYETCYYHPRVRAFEIEAETNMARMLQVEKFPVELNKKFLEEFKVLDDHWVYGKAVEWCKLSENSKKGQIGKAWISLFEREKRWKCIRSYKRSFSEEENVFELVKRDVPYIEEELITCLENWRKTGQSSTGKNWPDVDQKKNNLREIVRVDGPAYGVGISRLFDVTGPYGIVRDKGGEDPRSTRKLLQQMAGVNFVALRIFATKEIAGLVSEAIDEIMEKHPHFLPSHDA